MSSQLQMPAGGSGQNPPISGDLVPSDPVLIPNLPPTTGAPTLANDIQTTYNASVVNVAQLNAGLKARAAAAYADYVANMRSGENIPAYLKVPPTPPMAWELAPADAQGFVYYQIGTTPVCPQGPAVAANADNPPVNTIPNMIMMGGQNGSTMWWSALAGDTFPSGMTTPPQPDGHTYEKFGAPVGSGWYLRVS
jgi:hypothetical protein